MFGHILSFRETRRWLESIFKGHSLLFVVTSYLLTKPTVLNLESGSKITTVCHTHNHTLFLYFDEYSIE